MVLSAMVKMTNDKKKKVLLSRDRVHTYLFMTENEAWKFTYLHKSFMKLLQESLSPGYQDVGPLHIFLLSAHNSIYH